jgi:membrane protease YdiL (CAAX protease family)
MSMRIKTISTIVGLLFAFQLCLFGLKRLIFLAAPRISFTDSIAAMFAMSILTVLLIVYAKKRKIALSVFPRGFNKFYIIGTCIAVALLITAPSNYADGFPAIVLLFYGSVVTPIFEELIFRGYVWNRLNTLIKKEWVTYVITTVLFGVWHLGYIGSVSFRIETGLANIMMWKVIVGLCYGIVLGAVRLETKNSYSTMLLHGVMNIFGR